MHTILYNTREKYSWEPLASWLTQTSCLTSRRLFSIANLVWNKRVKTLGTSAAQSGKLSYWHSRLWEKTPSQLPIKFWRHFFTPLFQSQNLCACFEKILTSFAYNSKRFLAKSRPAWQKISNGVLKIDRGKRQCKRQASQKRQAARRAPKSVKDVL